MSEHPQVIGLIGSDTFSIDQALTELFKQVPSHTVVKVPSKLEELLFAPSFFKEPRLICLQGVDSWKEKEQGLVVQYLKRPDPSITLVIVAESIKPASDLYQALERYQIRNFAKETPWDKEARLCKWVEAFCKEKGKTITQRLCQQLVKGSRGEFHTLVHELDKLITYVGDAKEITESACVAISTLSEQNTLWQLSDAIIQGNLADALAILHNVDKQDVYSLIVVRHLRNSIHQLLEIASRIRSGQQNIAEHYPKLKGRLFEKALSNAQRIGLARLKQALLAIDAVENKLKDAAASEITLLQTLIVKLRNALSTA